MLSARPERVFVMNMKNQLHLKLGDSQNTQGIRTYRSHSLFVFLCSSSAESARNGAVAGSKTFEIVDSEQKVSICVLQFDNQTDQLTFFALLLLISLPLPLSLSLSRN